MPIIWRKMFHGVINLLPVSGLAYSSISALIFTLLFLSLQCLISAHISSSGSLALGSVSLLSPLFCPKKPKCNNSNLQTSRRFQTTDLRAALSPLIDKYLALSHWGPSQQDTHSVGSLSHLDTSKNRRLSSAPTWKNQCKSPFQSVLQLSVEDLAIEGSFILSVSFFFFRALFMSSWNYSLGGWKRICRPERSGQCVDI